MVIYMDTTVCADGMRIGVSTLGMGERTEWAAHDVPEVVVEALLLQLRTPCRRARCL